MCLERFVASVKRVALSPVLSRSRRNVYVLPEQLLRMISVRFGGAFVLFAICSEAKSRGRIIQQHRLNPSESCAVDRRPLRLFYVPRDAMGPRGNGRKVSWPCTSVSFSCWWAFHSSSTACGTSSVKLDPANGQDPTGSKLRTVNVYQS
jgi:hypothetical protein